MIVFYNKKPPKKFILKGDLEIIGDLSLNYAVKLTGREPSSCK
jgi:hypothetical protein